MIAALVWLVAIPLLWLVAIPLSLVALVGAWMTWELRRSHRDRIIIRIDGDRIHCDDPRVEFVDNNNRPVQREP